MQLLKQSTQRKVPVGPCVDATDGATLETSISWATTESYIMKNDAAALTDIGVNTWSSHLGGGVYNVTLTASNTDTLGLLVLFAHDAAMRPVRHEFSVVPANVYDSLISGTDYLQVDGMQLNGQNTSGMLSSGNTALNADVLKINTSAAAAANAQAAADTIVTGTVQTNSTTTVVTTNLTESTNDHYNGRLLAFRTGNLTGQVATISDYSGSSKNLTVSQLTEAPANGDTFAIL